jgi:hypothetical protein
MPTVRDFFAGEAAEYLERLDRIADGLDGGAVLGPEMLRISRALRGSALMAREEAFARVAAAMEGAARALADGRVRWTPDLGGRVRETLRDLRAMIVEGPEAGAARANAAAARFAGIGPAGGAADGGAAPGAERAFRDFAARESAGVLVTVQAALQGVAADPRDREPLKVVLRRQRALMGAARLHTIPILAETLTAIDEITRMVARLDVPVAGEWLETYSAARDVLEAAAAALEQGAEPLPGAALARLRTLRQQLVERYGVEEPPRQPPVIEPQDAATMAAEAAAASMLVGARAGAGAPARGPAPLAAAPQVELDGVVPIEQFLLRGERALARALELRAPLQHAVAGGPPRVRELLQEVFDLIELART